MTLIEHQTLDEERALYAAQELRVVSCRFDGPADGESALKESHDICVESSYFNLRYPFWHTDRLTVKESELTPLCRAALWYASDICMTDCRLHGIKALRECQNATLTRCSIRSAEFGWFNTAVSMRDCSAEGEYFMLRSRELHFENVTLQGKYSFQYIENATFENCNFDTKDAFWHAKNVTVKNSVIKGEYLAWYCENVTFDHCRIIGTQPLCYCKNLRLIDCEMIDTDLCFEKSEVEATLLSPLISIKNPRSGHITLPALDQLIRDDENSKATVTVRR